MNTKVKIGIASAIVAALVALIILDQKTIPREEAAPKAAPTGDNAITVVGNGADSPSPRVPEEEINTLLDKAKKEFGEKPPRSSPAQKGSEEKNERKSTSSANEEYVIKSQDTLDTIAEKHYGSKSYAHLIVEANPGIKPTTLRIGKRLVLPPKPVEKAEKREEAPVAKEPLPAAPTPAAEPKAPAPKAPEAVTVVGGQKIYTVQQGDTLSTISMQVYNTSRHYRKIYEANQDKIEDPNTLQVGMKLVMPDLPAKAPAANSSASGSGVVPTTAPPPSAPAGSKVVEVSKGSSLWTIAEKFAAERKIGIHEMIKLIVAANPDKLKDEGSLLRLGWQLIIPE